MLGGQGREKWEASLLCCAGFVSCPRKRFLLHGGPGLSGRVCRVRPLESNCCKRSLFSSTPAASRCVHQLFCCRAPEKPCAEN